MAIESLNEKFAELLDKFDQLNVNNQHIVERLNRLEADAVPASNTGGVKNKTALLGASPCGDLEQQTVKDTTLSFFPYQASYSSTLPAKVEKGNLSPDIVIAAEDIEGEFMTVKNSVQKIRLPPDLKLNESRQGIKREDQPILNLITKSARYMETTLKILGEGVATKSPLTNDQLDQISICQVAHLRHLQDEYATLVVKSRFNRTTSQFFRSLQRHTSGLNPAALKNLQIAASISGQRPRPQPSRGSNRGYYNSNSRSRGFCGRTGFRPDIFQEFTSSKFPRSRPDQSLEQSSHE